MKINVKVILRTKIKVCQIEGLKRTVA